MRGKKSFLREQRFQRFRKSDAVLALALAVLPVFNRLAAQNINFITEIDRLYNLSLLPQFMDGSTVKQFSSYDRTGGNNDGFEGVYKQIDLRITRDPEKQPAGYAPIADVFGFAFGKRSMNSLVMGVDYHNVLYCYFPMPFDEAATVELVYRDRTPPLKSVAIQSKISYTKQGRNRDKEGRFYIYWKREEPPLGRSYVFLEGSGKGHYVGTILQGQATEFSNFTEFFEGDDKTLVDGIMTVHGTGSEDYFNGGWYAQPGGWNEALGMYLHGCLDYSLPWSRTGEYRYFILDKMPFENRISHSIEHGPVNNRLVDYISTALYYADRAIHQPVVPTNKLTEVFIPDTFTYYPRLMNYLTYRKGIYRRNGDIEFNGNEGALKIDVNDLTAGRYKVFLHSTSEVPAKLKVGIMRSAHSLSWSKISLMKENQDIFIGEVQINEPWVPIEIRFQSTNGTRYTFNRIKFKKM